MKYNELTIKRNKRRNRVGRGISAGQGMTAGRGTKGQGSRKSSLKSGFAGGQTPLIMQLPKLRGFKSHHRAHEAVKTGDLEHIKKTVIDNATLAESGLVSSAFSSVKLIVNGELKSKKTVKLQSASAGAIKMVEKGGGTFEVTQRAARPKTEKTDKK
jgi:large subunit ribosomal protein L15